MCRISNLQLMFIGHGLGDKEVAKVKFRLYFSKTEKDMNMKFYVRAMLYERDDNLDHYFQTGRGFKKIPRGNSDDFAGTIKSAYVTPDGANYKDFEWERTWDFLTSESGAEEWRAVVYARPQVCADLRISNEISANVV